MFAKKTLVSALIAAGGLGALALPLPSAAASFDFFFNATPARHDTYYGRGHYRPSRFDRDGDGIANRYDRTPGGEVRMRDRDGDGVPDRLDNYPNNPRWR